MGEQMLPDPWRRRPRREDQTFVRLSPKRVPSRTIRVERTLRFSFLATNDSKSHRSVRLESLRFR